MSTGACFLQRGAAGSQGEPVFLLSREFQSVLFSFCVIDFIFEYFEVVGEIEWRAQSILAGIQHLALARALVTLVEPVLADGS